MSQGYKKQIAAGVIFAICFILAAQGAQMYENDLQYLVSHTGMWAPVLYILVTILAVVVAPLSTGFLLPIAANGFGPWQTALYSIAGWSIGSIIAFNLARRYGYGYLEELPLSKFIRRVEGRMSQVQQVVVILLLRMSLPVDVLSYALGLFSRVNYKVFVWTTILGVTPFAFLFSYASILPMQYQTFVMALCVSCFLGAVYFIGAYKSSKE
jgi:uncharacterized membrane protein YdjX (TVP38/TMEM64 family)